ncbi:DUF4381 domain-containing protein [Marinobacter panjinensis]|uniref:DUF4381 domain-containing protein n=1 Tax=Marinobacter panjinensis TaxID=2576384 RepID=A0A4U6R1E8_9GAMM|nr:DUF4381 domain-containing protein [Marinobacter panjinensis]MCR8913837.1 DUF4381 domain-containing protein [Marinobacter panjinensis]TKV67524.1 DUF4381 domain-containing protein [Marinobacter panjinensis]
MMEQDPLSQLRDIHLPQPGGFWPPAPGWWVLFAIALALAVLAFVLVRRKQRRNRWLGVAKRELLRLEQSAAADNDWFAALNRLLKQSARMRYPERAPESLSGEPWIRFLLETSPKDRVASRPVVEAMVNSAWQPVPGCRPEEAVAFARVWLGGQRC